MSVRLQRCSVIVIQNTFRKCDRLNIGFVFATNTVSLEQEKAGRKPELEGSSICLRLGNKLFLSVKYPDCYSPVAFNSGNPSKLVSKASIENFSRLGIAFVEGRLQMDDRMIAEEVASVQLEDSRSRQLQDVNPALKTKSEETPIMTSGDMVTEQRKGAGGDEMKAPAEVDVTDSRQCERGETPVEHHHLHLSSCNECLELENYTIESVKSASTENIPDLPDAYSSSVDSPASDQVSTQVKKINVVGKPPNILVYTGSDPDSTKFKQIQSVLKDCIDKDRYIIYPLQEKQALKDPWLDNLVLLVIASEEPISEEVQKKFLTYLSKGGKILGLSSLFRFGSIIVTAKDELKHKNKIIHFTKTDNTDIELNVLTSGKVFERDNENNFSNIQVLGYLDPPEKDLVIVRLPHGDCGGEALLIQVHLEASADSHMVQDEADFSSLKMSNSKRCEVLSEILTSLCLSCEPSEVPSLTPIYLLMAKETNRFSFLEWLRSLADADGIIKSPKVSLKLLTTPLPGVEVTPTLIPVVTTFPEFSSEYFSLHTYQQNLRTEKLGQIVFFVEVTPTTMSLFDGLMTNSPQGNGLIAIAARQTQGRGRGGNAWLSPVGCAMFTLLLSIKMDSKLGQRITFLQHLVALSVVEAVRTLPGYEAIDLRVKWPNDIYYSDIMKLGGVLVTSTLMDKTFHVLAGCGFNVANSNPTICINDVIMQYNKYNRTHLKPLSTDQLIARTVTVLEELMNTFQDKGANGVLPVYYKRWVHSGKQVRLWNEEGPFASITGLDDSGFLQVRTESGNIVTVQPDGNSFDMLKNLIVTK
ncbi:biotin--protein ligase isoform X2 [Protopterus annectens]|uniref:biotin--protein ligase isoform X2 n=1 Tax=Protopterus annectens TaxID=7888 RepID=UPI001CFBC645|nr:biotin--protein ligase isoform X2 [Protopterus annectens]